MKYWTIKEDKILEECFMNSDEPYNAAVRKLDRSRQAIRNRAYNLGLTETHKRDKEDKTFTNAERWAKWNEILNKAKELCGLPTTPASENPYRARRCEDEV